MDDRSVEIELARLDKCKLEKEVFEAKFNPISSIATKIMITVILFVVTAILYYVFGNPGK